ncbi:hypothetical protein WN944_010930 [Citrus x changshan-huyou]|uniref:Uncharacterized protein n=1 Tax=Citrus x changshan-huyou TaxID=2935761 RepID=A0AAP0R122_9ROSI
MLRMPVLLPNKIMACGLGLVMLEQLLVNVCFFVQQRHFVGVSPHKWFDGQILVISETVELLCSYTRLHYQYVELEFVSEIELSPSYEIFEIKSLLRLLISSEKSMSFCYNHQ